MAEQPQKNNAPQIPKEVTGWCWGAFWWTWIWGIRFGVWISLLMFIPIFNIVWWFVLGAKGRQWAWEKNQHMGVEAFNKSQRRWGIFGFIWLICWIVIFALAFSLSKHELAPLEAKSYGIVQQSPIIQQYVGGDMQRHSVTHYDIHSLAGGQNVGSLQYEVSGSTGSMRIMVHGKEVNNEWHVTKLVADTKDGKAYTLIPSASTMPNTRTLPMQQPVLSDPAPTQSSEAMPSHAPVTVPAHSDVVSH